MEKLSAKRKLGKLTVKNTQNKTKNRILVINIKKTIALCLNNRKAFSKSVINIIVGGNITHTYWYNTGQGNRDIIMQTIHHTCDTVMTDSKNYVNNQFKTNAFLYISWSFLQQTFELIGSLWGKLEKSVVKTNSWQRKNPVAITITQVQLIFNSHS